MTAKVYGIPNCSSVKKAIASLKGQEVDVLFHDIPAHNWATGGELWSVKLAKPKN